MRNIKIKHKRIFCKMKREISTMPFLKYFFTKMSFSKIPQIKILLNYKPQNLKKLNRVLTLTNSKS